MCSPRSRLQNKALLESVKLSSQKDFENSSAPLQWAGRARHRPLASWGNLPVASYLPSALNEELRPGHRAAGSAL